MFRAKQPHSNLAARMGRWSASHWKTATFGWLALVVVAFGIGGAVGVVNVDPNTAGPGESGRMDKILDAGFKQPAGESVLVQSDTLRTNDPAFPDAGPTQAGATPAPLTTSSTGSAQISSGSTSTTIGSSSSSSISSSTPSTTSSGLPGP